MAAKAKGLSMPVNYTALSLRELEEHAKVFREKLAYEKDDLIEWLYLEHKILQIRATKQGSMNRTLVHQKTYQHLYAMLPEERKWRHKQF
jgi:hypothetical protein